MDEIDAKGVLGRIAEFDVVVVALGGTLENDEALKDGVVESIFESEGLQLGVSDIDIVVVAFIVEVGVDVGVRNVESVSEGEQDGVVVADDVGEGAG